MLETLPWKGIANPFPARGGVQVSKKFPGESDQDVQV